MKIKRESIILAVLIVALSLYLLFHERDRAHYQLPVLQILPAGQIKKIEITKPGDPGILLERKDGKWSISPDNYPADSAKVSALLETIGNLNLNALVSESKNYERYGLSGTDKIGVKAWTDEGLKRDFEVGKEAPSFHHTFIKLAGDSRVFLARENFRSRFAETVDSLRDKTVLKFQPSEIESIEVRDAGKAVSFVRKQVPVEVNAGQESKSPPTGEKVVWESSEGQADEAKLTQLLTTLSALKCKGYIYDRKKADLKDPVYSVKVKGPEVYSLSLFAKDSKNDYPGVSSQNDSPFLFPEYEAVRIMMPPAELIKKADRSPAP